MDKIQSFNPKLKILGNNGYQDKVIVLYKNPLPYNINKHLGHPVGVVYHQLPMLHVRKAGDVTMGSERCEVAKHILGHEGFVLTLPKVHISAAYVFKTRGVDGLVGIAHGTPIARGIDLGKLVEQGIEVV